MDIFTSGYALQSMLKPNPFDAFKHKLWNVWMNQHDRESNQVFCYISQQFNDSPTLLQ